jgi:hypothetical protein
MWVDPGIDGPRVLCWVLFGLAGLGFVVFGARSERVAHVLAGLCLMVCPFFIANWIALTAVGAFVVAAPFAKERM